MMKTPGFAFLLGAILLSGCSAFKDKPLAPEHAAANFHARSLNDPELRTFLAAHSKRQGWRTGYWDLGSLTLAALYFHPDLDVARAKYAVAEAGKETAGQLPNPTLALAPGNNTTTSGVSPWILGFAFDWPIETAGKRGYRKAQSWQLAEAERYRIASTAWDVRSRVRQALVALQASRDMEKLVRKQLGFQTEVVNLLELQKDAGEVSPYEVSQARIALDNAQLSLCDAERAKADARMLLAQALGIPATGLDSADISFADFSKSPAVPSLGARRQAILNRADLLAALAEYSASQSALQLAVAKQYPDLHIGPGYQLDQTDNKWSLGLGLELPVLQHHRGEVREAEAKREQSAAQFTALQAKVIGDVDWAVTNYQAAAKKIALVDSLRGNLVKQENIVKAMAQAGETSKLNLATTQVELATNELARLEALLKVQQALGQLEDTMQSPAALPESLWAENPRRK